MEITEEQRAAVLAQMCAEQGHLIDIDEAISDDPDIDEHQPTINVRARDADSVPHLRCKRCPTVWLVMPGAPSYEAAEQELNDQLEPKHRRKLRRVRRQERVAAEQAAAAERAAEAAAQAVPAPAVPPSGSPAPSPAPAPGR